jgi:hypothetical protein
MNNPLKQVKIQILILLTFIFLPFVALAQPRTHAFNPLPQQWDDAIPMGNGMIGSLI